MACEGRPSGANVQERFRNSSPSLVVGGGPTGVELAARSAKSARDTLTHEFGRLILRCPHRAVASERIGFSRSYPGRLPAKAQKQLEPLGVTASDRTLASRHRGRPCDHDRAGEQTERIPTRTVLWAAGVQSVKSESADRQLCGIETDRAGRIPVEAESHGSGLSGGFRDRRYGQVLPAGRESLCRAWRRRHPIRATCRPHHPANRLQSKPTSPFRYRDYV